MRCEKCGCKMVKVYSFERDKAFEFKRCPKCWFETKHVKARFDDIQLKQNSNISRIRYNKKKGRKPS